MAGFTPRWFTCPQAVTHHSTNRARRRVTSFQPKRITNYTTPPTIVVVVTVVLVMLAIKDKTQADTAKKPSGFFYKSKLN